MQSLSHDFSIISYQGAHCGLSTCSRNSPHYHCRICGYGTSQVGNAVSHGRLCASNDIQLKDFSNMPACSDGIYPASSQAFSFYPQPPTTTATTSKMITSQQSAMFNYVIPPQNPQYGGLYGPQTVFPNPNLFSPSNFTNYTQLDSTWVTQSRLISTNVVPSATSPPESGARSTTSPNCCRNDLAPLSLPSPIAAESFRSSSKESTNLYCSSQNVISQQKYPESSASSCSISLLFLEQTEEVEVCIDVDDICLPSKNKEELSSCLQTEEKSEVSSSLSSKASDIVVEDTEFDSSDSNEENVPKCFVCDIISPDCVALTDKTPLTDSSQASVLTKVSSILQKQSEIDSSICNYCLNLVNVVDSLEAKLIKATEELQIIHKNRKDNKELKLSEENKLDDSLVCQTCDKTFSSLAYLTKHKQHHTQSFSYCCEYCGKGFTDLQKLENHISLHSKTLRFQCELCGKQFLEKHTLINHIRQHKGDHRYECNICKKGFVQKSAFKSHMQNHDGRFYICQHCGRKVKTYSNLMVHIKICTGDLKYACEDCDKKFPLKSLLEKHISINHKCEYKFTCTTCQKGFWKKSDLEYHSKSHSNDKPYSCNTCGKCYKSKKTLNHHSRLHGSGPNFKCSVCGKEFTRADALADHMNNHTGKKPYQCQTCWKKFANRINYSVHLKRHDKNEKNTCTICDKVVKSLKEHKQVHSDKKPFACEKCPTVFSFKNSMVKHMKLKHGDCKDNKLN